MALAAPTQQLVRAPAAQFAESVLQSDEFSYAICAIYLIVIKLVCIDDAHSLAQPIKDATASVVNGWCLLMPNC
jgi:hypothetical protein